MRHVGARGAGSLGALIAVLAAALLMQGCGTLYATAKNPRGDDVMLLGHDPVAYFTDARPVRGSREISSTLSGRSYYFASVAHKQVFDADPARYEPQYGGFCSDGAAFGIKMSTDPGEFEIVEGRLFIFGDILGHEMWKLDPAWNIAHADRLWPEAGNTGHRWQSLKRYIFKVPHYLTGRELTDEWRRRNPGKSLTYDPGGMLDNLFLKPTGWRAAEGFGQPAVGYPD
ncbi:MAG: YHS domain-containing (seleno)protein [Casimicrobiaceae bacterium]